MNHLLFKHSSIACSLLILLFSTLSNSAYSEPTSSTLVHSEQHLTSPPYQTAMLELYTSQGCSSCPPAEQWISKFVDDPKLWKEIVPINFRVDYWDYLGWKDHYSNPVFSTRQRAYRQLGHSPTVATPGFIINGKGWHGWFYNRPLRAENLNDAGVLDVRISSASNSTEAQAKIEFTQTKNISQPLSVHLAILGFGLEDYIGRGENRGETFIQDFVVLGYDQKVLATNTNINTNTGSTIIQLPNVSEFQAKRLAVAVWVSSLQDPSPIQAVADWLQ